MSEISERAIPLMLALYQAPALASEIRDIPLPADMLIALRIAAGDVIALRAAAQTTGMEQAELREAAVLLLEQTMFFDGADSYRRLGARPEISRDELKNHHRWLMHWLHPDRNRDGQSIYAEGINRAWNDLRTPKRRAIYDAKMSVDEPKHSPAFNHYLVTNRHWQVQAHPVPAPFVSGRLLRMLPPYVIGTAALLMLGVLTLMHAQRPVMLPSLPNRPTETSIAVNELVPQEQTAIRDAAAPIEARATVSAASEAIQSAPRPNLLTVAPTSLNGNSASGEAPAAPVAKLAQASGDVVSAVQRLPAKLDSNAARAIGAETLPPASRDGETSKAHASPSQADAATTPLVSTKPAYAIAEISAMDVGPAASVVLNESDGRSLTTITSAGRAMASTTRATPTEEAVGSNNTLASTSAPAMTTVNVAVPALDASATDVPTTSSTKIVEATVAAPMPSAVVVSVAPLGDRLTPDRAEALVTRLVDAFHEGDTPRLLGLFAPSVHTGQSRQRAREYDALFATSKSRSLVISNVGWLIRDQGNAALGLGRFDIVYNDAKTGALLIRSGRFQIELKADGESARIVQLIGAR